MYHYLGYDPIHGDYKVLCMTKGMNIGWRRGLAEDLRVLTLGNGSSWRMIEDFPPHAPASLDLCIDGVKLLLTHIRLFSTKIKQSCVLMLGEFVLAPETMFHEPPFYVLYYDPKKNAVSRVFIEGITELKLLRWDSHLNRSVISIFPGQVENLMFL
ncbi:unnamed protein product [Arabidopsis arenosa]|uniref:F-box associated beta-propeller type 3 domain-containing protein n=1 Tax=Arabidopsis arenosa TaxID=38785 RepID=A0A8S2AE53_ARAAE|nr:unnamed protein product [Arabidopsis arenosa]